MKKPGSVAQIFKCEKCGQTFNDVNKYRGHRVDHAQGRVQAKIDQKPQRVEIKSLPTPKRTAAEIKEATVENIVEKPKKKPPVSPPPTVSKEKIKLKYKYEGACNCGQVVDTLELDGVVKGEENKTVVLLAWCPSCKKQVRQRTTHKL